MRKSFSNTKRQTGRKTKLPISRARYHLVPLIGDLFAKKSFSGHKIDQILKENHLSPEDRALFTELFYGFLRYGHRLLYFVDKFLAKPEKIPDKIKWILAIGFYQKLYLTKIPDHAIVNESVEMAKHFIKGDAMGNLVNAVMQKFLKHHARFHELDNYPLWVQTSFPEWMSDYLSEMWTPMGFFKLSKNLNVASPTYIRANAAKISEEKLIIKLGKENIKCEQTSVTNCLLLPNLSVSPKDVPGYHEGMWTIQNMASQRIVHFLDLQDGDVVLDCCAGYGGKTLQMAELSKDKTDIHYFDVVDKKMHAVDIRSQKMGMRRVKGVNVFEQKYNKLLIDSPCSGLGTISSHPEIKWFRTLKDLEDQRAKQKEVINKYSQYLLPGGTMLYAVCSIDKNEGEEIIKTFLADHPDFQIDETFKTPFTDVELGTYLMPTLKGESGYFFSRLIRNKE
ncbi:hypothetical protein BVY03_03760 [bacterium K02(2017)]|nr:hypothetical protein BVY03_03760 [bacterium K02(2017)]